MLPLISQTVGLLHIGNLWRTYPDECWNDGEEGVSAQADEVE